MESEEHTSNGKGGIGLGAGMDDQEQGEKGRAHSTNAGLSHPEIKTPVSSKWHRLTPKVE